MTSDVIAPVLLWSEGVVVETLEGNYPMPAITLKLTPFLRVALLGDAAASSATGLLLATAAGPLSPLLGLSEPLLRGAGLVLLPYAAAIAWAGTRAAPPRWAVRGAAALNLLWTADSLLLLIWRPVSPTGLGVTIVLAQALVVLGFAVAQWAVLRRTSAAAEAAPAFV
jgi:hypothetical protein